MDLVTPGLGLFFWSGVTFLIVLAFLSVFVWRPIMSALRVREDFINDSLQSAEKAKTEMEKLQADNSKLLQEARLERDKILKEATEVANKIKEDAKEETAKISDKMLADAKASIESEKQAALGEVKVLVASLSIEIAEKVLKKNLSSDADQKQLVDGLIQDIKVN